MRLGRTPWRITLSTASTVIAGFGLIVMLGWLIGSTSIVQLRASWPAVQFSTALCFVLCGAASGLLAFGMLRWVRVLALFAALMAMLTLFEYWFFLDLHIDPFLVPENGLVEHLGPGRMPPNSAISFSVAAVALLLYTVEANRAAMGLAALVVGLATVSLCGYLTGVERAYGWGSFSEMAVHSALGQLALGGVLIGHWYSRGITASEYGAIPLGIALLTATLCLWQAVTADQYRSVEERVALHGKFIARTLEALANDRVRALRRQATRWESGGELDDAQWRRDAARYVADYPEILAMTLLDENLVPRWVEPQSEAAAADLDDALQHLGRSLQEPLTDTRMIKLSTDPGKRYDVGIVIPLRNDGEGISYLCSRVQLDRLAALASSPDQTEVRILLQKLPLPGAMGESLTSSALAAHFNLHLFGHDLQLTAVPNPPLFTPAEALIPTVVLWAGIILTALLTLLTWVYFHARHVRGDLEHRLHLAMDASGMGVWDLDPETRTVTWDARSRAMYEYVQDDRAPRFEEIVRKVHPADLEFINQAVRRALKAKETYCAEFRVILEGGGIRYVRALGQANRDGRGKLRSLIGVNIDITEQREAERMLRRMNEELEERVRHRTAALQAANDELESFSYSVSHDLRAPLRHISGFIQLLRRRIDGTIDEKATHYMDQIQSSADRLGLLIDELLAFSRMGRAALKIEAVNMTELVRLVCKEFDESLPERQIHWEIAPLPMLRVDPAMMRIVFQNLIDNALKFSSQQKVSKISVRCDGGDAGFQFSITDNGVGFDMQFADKLFGVFQRLHHNDQFQGTGVGLASVRRIIVKHGGSVSATSTPGLGTTISFILPPGVTAEEPLHHA